MKKLGILIGTEDEPISKKYYQKNKFKPLNEEKILELVKKEME